jgi:hypothetical protein
MSRGLLHTYIYVVLGDFDYMEINKEKKKRSGE